MKFTRKKPIYNRLFKVIQSLFLFGIAPAVFAQSSIEFKAENDTAKTDPLAEITVNVIENDMITCNDYSISITAYPPSSVGNAHLINNEAIRFKPAKDFFGEVRIPYELTCEASAKTNAFLIINVSPYSTPTNVLPETGGCIEYMEEGVSFEPALKYANTNVRINGFSMPLVGDLNGDGKPEIIALGLEGSDNGVGLSARGRYVVIYDGQTGQDLISFDLRSLGSGGIDDYGGSNQFRLRYNPRHNSPSHLAIADLDRDGIGEIVVTETGSRGRVYALKPVLDSNKKITGLTKLWDASVSHKSPITIGVEQFGEPIPYISDLNADGIPEVIVYNKIYNGLSGQLILELETLAYYRAEFNYIYTENDWLTRRKSSYVGRRHGYSSEGDDAIPVISIIDIDQDGKMEIVAGMKIYKLNITNPENTSNNSFSIIEGPASVALPYGRDSLFRTYYLMDGFTSVADIDGDGKLDVIVQSNITQNWDDDYRGLVVVWDPQNTEQVKAASIFRGNSAVGMASIPFIGDINGNADDFTGTKKLPEICFVTGVLYYQRYAQLDNYVSGIPFHPQAAEVLGANNRYFNKAQGIGAEQARGHVFALTYHGDANTAIHDRLKLSWAMEHEDMSAATGITMFDFDNDGIMELCYRDEKSLRVISPKLQTYIRKAETSNAIRFKASDIKSYTGFEAPVIADVNKDGSADIIVASYPASDPVNERSYGNIYVYEHKSGSDKWAPAPAVWNQAIYFPLQINENLSVPVKPQSTLTTYTTKDGETIRPYNGSWVQQPIISENGYFAPIFLQPDIAISQFTVNTSTSPATIQLTLKNLGTATANANTPVTFYKDSLDGDIIMTVQTGVDIFPEEQKTISYNLPEGNYKEVLIWCRVIDNGDGVFPAEGYLDCNPDNNAFAAIDCPDMVVDIKASPSSNICGYNASVMLEVTTADNYASPSYQWYKNESIIAGANSPTYFAEEKGVYKVYVIDGLCRKFSSSITVSSSTGTYPKPVLTSNQDSVVCGENGSIYLQIQNSSDYASSVYHWFRDGIQIAQSDSPYFMTDTGGLFQVYVGTENCGAVSNSIALKENTATVTEPSLTARPSDSWEICGDNGVLLVNVDNTAAYENPSFQWYKNNIAVPGAVSPEFLVETEGTYFVKVKDSFCTSYSTPKSVTKNTDAFVRPNINDEPEQGAICGPNSQVFLYVTNKIAYNNPVYIWYKDNEIKQQGSKEIFTASEEGLYSLRIVDGSCASVSNTIDIKLSSDSIALPKIEQTVEDANICGATGSLILSLSNFDQYSAKATFRWFRDTAMITTDDARGPIYRASGEGIYRLMVVDSICSAISNETYVNQSPNIGDTIIKPILIKYSALRSRQLCNQGGSMLLAVSNDSVYKNPVYVWFNGYSILPDSTAVIEVTKAGDYYVQVIEGHCSDISNTITLSESATQITKPEITSLSSGYNLCGDSASIVLKLANADQYSQATYQWYKNNQPVAYANQEAFHVKSAGDYRIQVLEGFCTSLSSPKTITKEGNDSIIKPALQVMPLSGDICHPNGRVMLWVSNDSVYENGSYAWFRNNIKLTGADSSVIYIDQEGDYFVMRLNGNCAASSAIQSITAVDLDIYKPQIVSIPDNNTLCGENSSVVLRLHNYPQYYNPVYQWYKNDKAIDDATKAIHVATQAGDYRLRIANDLGCMTFSEIFSVTDRGGTHTKPTLSANPEAAEIIGGIAVELSVSNEAALENPVRYIWYNTFDTVQDGGNTFEAEYPELYFVQVVFNDDCSALSDPVKVTSAEPSIERPIVKTTPDLNELCSGGYVLLEVSNSHRYYQPTYQWRKDNVPVPDENKSFIYVNEEGIYTVIVTDTGTNSAPSAAIEVKSKSSTVPTPLLAKSGIALCGENGSMFLSVENSGDYSTTAQYTWVKNGMIMQQSTQHTYTASDTGVYHVRVLDQGCLAKSKDDTLKASNTSIEIVEIAPFEQESIICGATGTIILQITNTNLFPNGSYQWFRNHQPIADETDSLLRIEADYGTGVYQAQVSIDHCSSLSQAIPVTYSARQTIKPEIAQIPENGKLCAENGQVLLSVSNADEFNNALYVWFKDSLNIIQKSESTFLEVHEPGIYTVYEVSGLCASESDPVTIDTSETPIATPLIETAGSGNIICNGDSTAILLVVTNSDNYLAASFQWYFNNKPIAGANQARYKANKAGDYKVLITENPCSVFSNTLSLVKPGTDFIYQPKISMAPENGIICGDSSQILLNVANASDFSKNATFTWFQGNSVIKTSSTPFLYTDTGGLYYVQVEDGVCASVSQEKTVVKTSDIINRPNIASRPEGIQSICGDNGALDLLLTNRSLFGDEATFQWYHNQKIIPSANAYIHQAALPGTYQLLVSAGHCAVFSDTLEITKQPSEVQKPTLGTIPAKAELCFENGSILLNIENIKSYPLASNFIWYRNNEEIQNGTSSVLEIRSNNADNTYMVQVITPTGCSILSDTMPIKNHANPAIEKPRIASINGITNICQEDGRVFIKLENPSDYPDATFSWYNGTSYIHGENGSIYQAKDSGYYRVMVTQGHCAIFSDSLKITKDGYASIKQPILTTDPESAYLCGESSSLILKIANDTLFENPVYTWIKDQKIIASSDIPAYETNEAGSYIVIAEENQCSALSDVKTVSQSETSIIKPILKSIPDSSHICGNTGAVIIYMENSGEYVNPSFQWYKGIELIAGAQSAKYHAPDSGSYRVLVRENHCSAFSDLVKVTIDLADSIKTPVLATISDKDICNEGGSLLLSIKNDSAYKQPNYVWFRNDSVVAESSSPVFKTRDSGVYYVQVEDGYCAAISNEIKADIKIGKIAEPRINSIPGSNVLCGENAVVLLELTNADAYNNPTFQWLNKGEIIAGATGSYHEAESSGSYQVLVSESNCDAVSDIKTITKNTSTIKKPVIETLENNTLCGENDSLMLFISNYDEYVNPYFYWYKGDTMVYSHAIPEYTVNIADTFKVFVMDNACGTFSDPKVIQSESRPTLSNITYTQGDTVCSGSNARLYAESNLTGNLVSWYADSALTNLIGNDNETTVNAITETKDYYVVAKSVAGCEASASDAVKVQVLVLERPDRSDVIAVSGDSICEGSDAMLSIQVSENISETRWYSDSTLTTLISEEQSFTWGGLTETSDLWVTVINKDLCALENAVKVTVFVDAMPSLSVADKYYYCEGDEVDLRQLVEGNGIIRFFSDPERLHELASAVVSPSGDSIFYASVTNGRCDKTLPIHLHKNLSSNIIIPRWNNTLIVNNNPETNGGYKFKEDSYQWYKDGELIPLENKQSYSAGDYEDDLLDENAVYSFRAVTIQGDTVFSCPGNYYEERALGIRIYPNPANVNQPVNVVIENSAIKQTDGYIEVFDISGRLMKRQILKQQVNELNVFTHPGVYIIKINSLSENDEQFKIVVK